MKQVEHDPSRGKPTAGRETAGKVRESTGGGFQDVRGRRRSQSTSTGPECVARAPQRPTREQAFEAFCTLLAFVVAGTSSPVSYDADHLPPGIPRDAFLRRHRDRLRAGVPGWTRVGHGRLVTAEAWASDVAVETSRTRARRTAVSAPAVNDTQDALDVALGIRVRRRP